MPSFTRAHSTKGDLVSTRSVIRFACALAQVAVMVGCSDYTAPTQGDGPLTGQFNLVSADDQALPATVFDGTIVADPEPPFHLRVVATSGSIVLDANGHYEQRVEHNTMIDGVFNGRVIRVDRGDCTRTVSQLTCVSNFLEGVEFTGTIAGQTITIAQDLTGEGRVAEYRYVL